MSQLKNKMIKITNIKNKKIKIIFQPVFFISNYKNEKNNIHNINFIHKKKCLQRFILSFQLRILYKQNILNEFCKIITTL